MARAVGAASLDSWQPEEGVSVVREPRCRCEEFAEPEPVVCVEWESLLADLPDEVPASLLD